MRKIMHISLSVLMLAVTLVLPAGAAVPNNKIRYTYRFVNLYNQPVKTQPTAPSVPKETQPVTPATGTTKTESPVQNTTDTSAQSLTADENYILQQVNAERSKAGLAPLQIDYRLVQTARAKSQDMIDHGYFDHQSPVLGSPFDQMKRAGISYKTAGENIAGASSAAQAMVLWMNSPGHKANILNPSFTHIGIGVINGGPNGEMMTQQFIG